MRTHMAGVKPILRRNQFQHKAVALPVVCAENLNAGVAMMKSAQDGA
jgi:hypothetical protein